MDTAIDELVEVGCARTVACELVGRSRASHYRARGGAPTADRPGRTGHSLDSAWLRGMARGVPGPAEPVWGAPGRGQTLSARRVRPRGVQPRALLAAEAAAVLETLHSQRFVDVAPASVYATLLDEGVYLCSVPTMYRLLRARGESRERRAQSVHPALVKPELIATAPNDVWSWDIERHEALRNRAVVKGHGLPPVAAGGMKLRAA